MNARANIAESRRRGEVTEHWRDADCDRASYSLTGSLRYFFLLFLLVAGAGKGLAQGGPPVITSQPQSLTVTQGLGASFTVTVSSVTYPIYQWRFNSTNTL